MFGCVLFDGTGRLSRDLGRAHRMAKEPKVAEVKIVYVGQGFDNESGSASMLRAIFGGINEQYLVDLGRKTFRGVECLTEKDASLLVGKRPQRRSRGRCGHPPHSPHVQLMRKEKNYSGSFNRFTYSYS